MAHTDQNHSSAAEVPEASRLDAGPRRRERPSEEDITPRAPREARPRPRPDDRSILISNDKQLRDEEGRKPRERRPALKPKDRPDEVPDIADSFAQNNGRDKGERPRMRPVDIEPGNSRENQSQPADLDGRHQRPERPRLAPANEISRPANPETARPDRRMRPASDRMVPPSPEPQRKSNQTAEPDRRMRPDSNRMIPTANISTDGERQMKAAHFVDIEKKPVKHRKDAAEEFKREHHGDDDRNGNDGRHGQHGSKGHHSTTVINNTTVVNNVTNVNVYNYYTSPRTYCGDYFYSAPPAPIHRHRNHRFYDHGIVTHVDRIYYAPFLPTYEYRYTAVAYAPRRIVYKRYVCTPYVERHFVVYPWYTTFYYSTYRDWHSAAAYAPGFSYGFSYALADDDYALRFSFGYGSGVRFGDEPWVYSWYPCSGYQKIMVSDESADYYDDYEAPDTY